MYPATQIGAIEESEAYEAMSIASRAAAQVQRGVAHISVASKLWRLNKILKTFSDSLYRPNPNAEPPTTEQVQIAIKVLYHLHSVLDRLCITAQRAGYANNSLTSIPLTSIRKMAEDFFDLADAIEIYQDQAVLDCFENARAEYLRGETVSLDSLD